MMLIKQVTDYKYFTPPRSANPEIKLWDGGDGTLMIDKPTSDAVRGGNHVIWWIVNESKTRHKVVLRNFRVKCTGESEWPFNDPQHDPSEIVNAGEIGRIRLETKNKGPDKKTGAWPYQYDIVIDDTPVEPEIIVEWPPI